MTMLSFIYLNMQSMFHFQWCILVRASPHELNVNESIQLVNSNRIILVVVVVVFHTIEKYIQVYELTNTTIFAI